MIEVLGGLGPYAHRDRRTYEDRFSVEDAVGNTPLGLFVEGLGQHFRKSGMVKTGLPHGERGRLAS